MNRSIDRRTLLATSAMLALGSQRLSARSQSTPVAVEPVDRLVIDLPGEPSTLHPAKAYSDIEWAAVHSIYDAIIGFDADGAMQPIGAERFELIDDTTWEVVLPEGRTFHDGSPVTAAAVARGIELVQGSDSLVADTFGAITSVEEVDERTARIVCDSPSPWLPSQMAAWVVLVPESFSENEAIGSGPYTFGGWDRGSELRLQRNESYVVSPAKGTPIANEVTYHFVPESTTRASNVLSESSDVATFMPLDAIGTLEVAGVTVMRSEVAGSTWIRFATDTAPFDDVRVRQALNLALNLEAFKGSLIHEDSRLLASILPGEMSAGFDPELAPYRYDVDAAKALLVDAGIEEIQTQLEVSTDANLTQCEAIVSQWAEIGVTAEIVVSDMASFNATWTSTDAPPLRLASWSPLFDPSMLFQLVFYGEGILSRYDNDELNGVLEQAFGEMDDVQRADLFREAGRIMHDDAACVFLWNLENVTGLSANASAWTPRADQWPIALAR